MSQQKTASSNTPWVVAIAAAAFAIGVATSDAVKDAVLDIQDVIRTYKGESGLQELTALPSQVQVVDPAGFAVMPLVPPANIANVTTVD